MTPRERREVSVEMYKTPTTNYPRIRSVRLSLRNWRRRLHHALRDQSNTTLTIKRFELTQTPASITAPTRVVT